MVVNCWIIIMIKDYMIKIENKLCWWKVLRFVGLIRLGCVIVEFMWVYFYKVVKYLFWCEFVKKLGFL